MATALRESLTLHTLMHVVPAIIESGHPVLNMVNWQQQPEKGIAADVRGCGRPTLVNGNAVNVLHLQQRK